MIRLSDIRDTFEGVIPSCIATTDETGMPNISYLSHVYYVDEGHVALSNQFFSKTAANVRRNGMATVMVVDGRTGQQYMLDLVYARSEENGALFERVASHLEVMAAGQGMGDIMKLRSVDLYVVEDCRIVPAVAPLELAPQKPVPVNHLSMAAELSGAIAAETDAEDMLDRALEGLETLFGYRNAMVLVPDEETGRLSTIASRGYSHFGIGAETEIGRGTIGVAAQSRRPLRISDLSRSQRYVSAVRAATVERTAEAIPFPTLSGARSQLAVPMCARGRLVGVLFIESGEPFAFGHRDEEALRTIASQLASGLTLAERERADAEHAANASMAGTPPPGASVFRLRYFPRDGSVFVNDDYLIRGVPGRLLAHFMRQYLESGRTDFSNREIRHEPDLQLPDFKDNLETRLILLRRRLEEKGGPIRITRPERGRVRMEVDGVPDFEIVET